MDNLLRKEFHEHIFMKDKTLTKVKLGWLTYNFVSKIPEYNVWVTYICNKTRYEELWLHTFFLFAMPPPEPEPIIILRDEKKLVSVYRF